MRFFVLAVLLLSSTLHAQVFRCSPAQGAALLTSATVYGNGSSFGFEPNAIPDTFHDGSCRSEKGFLFSVSKPDGDYRVRLVLGGQSPSITTVKGEARRVYVDQLPIAAGKWKTVTFNVHVRTRTIAGTSDVVELKPREIGSADWDDKLTLEFDGTPSLQSITIAPAHVPILYLAGDSTVVDQDDEPWAAWGQMLPVFVTDKISVANEAESGETSLSFVRENRLKKIESTWEKGDFLLIQFAHNDQKAGSGLSANTTYKDMLRRYIQEARAAGVTPILVTSMHRRSFDEQGKIKQTLGDFPQAMRDVALEQRVALIDLNAMSKTLFEALGPDGTLKAFVHYPANTFPGQKTELADNTHFNSYGAYQLASCVVQSVKDQHLPLARFLKQDMPPFDPAHPMSSAAWTLPLSPTYSAITPYGNTGVTK